MDPDQVSNEQQPEAAPPPASDDYGLNPDQLRQAASLYKGLNDLDRRHTVLREVLRPDVDGQLLRSYGQEQEQQNQEFDPFQRFQGGDEDGEFYDPNEQYYQEPQAEPFDPRQLQPVFEDYGTQIEQRIFTRLGEMAQQQQLSDSADAALSERKLPAALKGVIEQRARDAQRLHPNRQIRDLANEAADALQREIESHYAAPPASPPPASGPPPPGPSPDPGGEVPQSFEDMVRYAQERMK